MATDKRKRAIRALATERGISYTTAMRLHDAEAKAPAPARPVGWTPFSTRHPAAFIVAGHDLTLDTPLAIVGNPGSGSSALACQLATQGLLKGSDVHIFSSFRNVRPFQGVEGPGNLSLTVLKDSPVAVVIQGIKALDEEIRRRFTVMHQHGALTWLHLPAEVRDRENMNHSVLVVEDHLSIDSVLPPASPKEESLFTLMLKLMDHLTDIRRKGRTVGVYSVAVGRRSYTDLLQQLTRYQITRLAFTWTTESRPELLEILSWFDVDVEQMKRDLSTLANGEVIILSREEGVQRGSFRVEPGQLT